MGKTHYNKLDYGFCDDDDTQPHQHVSAQDGVVIKRDNIIQRINLKMLPRFNNHIHGYLYLLPVCLC